MIRYFRCSVLGTLFWVVAPSSIIAVRRYIIGLVACSLCSAQVGQCLGKDLLRTVAYTDGPIAGFSNSVDFGFVSLPSIPHSGHVAFRAIK